MQLDVDRSRALFSLFCDHFWATSTFVSRFFLLFGTHRRLSLFVMAYVVFAKFVRELLVLAVVVLEAEESLEVKFCLRVVGIRSSADSQEASSWCLHYQGRS